MALCSEDASATEMFDISSEIAASSEHPKLHPFPARMAPDIALRALGSLLPESNVLDPMCGSGTVLREAARNGHNAVGFDIDPLAVLMARVRSRPLDSACLLETGSRLVDRALRLRADEIVLPWIDEDLETRQFVNYWFALDQQKTLRPLAWLLAHSRGPVGHALRLAISKIIVTKEPKASLARDTSHSRPHRVTVNNSYDVAQGFIQAVAQIARGLERDSLTGSVTVQRRDARRLSPRLAGQMDAVVTSPPYGNSIDYLRGHRLALVWLGYTIPQLRAIRGKSVGSEMSLHGKRRTARVQELVSYLGPINELDSSTKRRLNRFAWDIFTVLKQIHIALRPQAQAVIVVGNSTVNDVFVNNTRMIAAAAQWVGLEEVSRYSREIPANHRYLPPPQPGSESRLGKRIKEEVVLTFRKA
jgi:SAM-dependent methyltransferase